MFCFSKDITTASGIGVKDAHVEVMGVHIHYGKRMLKVDLAVWTNEAARKAGMPPVPDPRIPMQVAFTGDDFLDPIQEMPADLERKISDWLNQIED
jgi:hypothetical protein